MKTRIANLKDPFVPCDYGKVGEETANAFEEEGLPFVIIDNSPERLARAERSEYIYLGGDATKDEVLQRGGNRESSGPGSGSRERCR